MDHRFSLLLIEDDVLLGPLYVELLGTAGYVVHHATDCTAARALLEEYRPDLLLLDVMLPDQSGVEFLEELSTTYSAPVVMLSNLDQPSITSRCVQLGVAGYLIKSELTPDSFLNAVATQLVKYSKEDQSGSALGLSLQPSPNFDRI